jgi:hypothetical protein
MSVPHTSVIRVGIINGEVQVVCQCDHCDVFEIRVPVEHMATVSNALAEAARQFGLTSQIETLTTTTHQASADEYMSVMQGKSRTH